MVKRGRSEFVAASVVVQLSIAVAITSLLWRKRKPVLPAAGALTLSASAGGIKGTPWTLPLRMPLIQEAGGLLVVVADPTIPA
jgi:hypothetical protein